MLNLIKKIYLIAGNLNLICLLLLSVIPIGLRSQNLETIGSKNPLKMSGGLSANQILYLSADTFLRRTPYTWVATGSLNFNLYDWNVPFSFTVSNYNKSFQQPFNQYSMHPNYKWVTLHVGYCNMTFSPYTLSGHTFLGAGVELAPPGIFRFSAMYGRLQRTIGPDTSNLSIKPAYKRMGYGFKAGVSKDNHLLEVTLFKASDDINSLGPIITDSLLTPKENLVLSVGGKTAIIKNLTLSAEFAGSSYTKNLLSGYQTGAGNNIYIATGLFKMRQSSSIYNAFKSGITYALNKSSIGLGYERVEPGYTTLGAYYSNNDFENYTVNTSTVIFKDKVNLSVNAGIQHDNLDNKKTSRTNRVVSSINIGYNASEKLNLSGSYSNFQTYTHIRSQFEVINQLTQYSNPDTLNFTQLSQSTNFNASYALSSSETKRQSINLNVNYMLANDKQASRNEGSSFLNTNISYSHCMVPVNLSITGAFNTSYNKMSLMNALTLGPSVSVSKMFLNKTLRSTISVSENKSYSNGKNINSAFTTRLTSAYSLLKKHNISLSLVWALRNNKTSNTTNKMSEFTGTMSYTYNF